MNNRWIFPSVLIGGVILGLTIGLGYAQGVQPNEGDLSQGITSELVSVGTAFTYQGQLKRNGDPINDTCDFQFSLWDSQSNTSGQVGSTQTRSGIQVLDGYFTIPDLDFGGEAFQGEARWLQIAVKCPGDADYVTLSPRQALTAVPYALYTKSAWSLGGNRNTDATKNFLGTTDNQALEIKVNNQRILRLEPHMNIIGGSGYNSVSAGVIGAAIGGGGSNTSPNQVTANYGAIGGGVSNTAAGFVATVGGGRLNNANGEDTAIGGGAANRASGQAATIAGGNQNTANGYAATVSGGGNNTANSEGSAVGGGMNNLASGGNSVIGGGAYNTANQSFATVPGGYRAVADQYGQMAYAGGMFANNGDAQTSLYVLRNTTSTADWTNLFLDGSNDLLNIAAGRTITFDILIVGRSDKGESAGYQIQGVIGNISGTVSFIGVPTVNVLGEDNEDWNVQVIADDTSDALCIEVMGNDKNIRWVAVVRTVEVSW